MTETPQPPALPADEPQAVDEYGVTGEEQRLGESMAGRLEREEPDIGACDPSEGRVGGWSSRTRVPVPTTRRT